MPWNRSTARDYADLGPQAHLDVLRPWLSACLAGRDGVRALDFGCGSGELSVCLAESGAARVTALDECEKMIEAARRQVEAAPASMRQRIELQRGDETALPVRPACDVVLCSLVLMMCATEARLRKTITGLIESLNADGMAMIVLTHPCFRRGGYATFHYEVPADYNYWSNGKAYDVVLAAGRADQTDRAKRSDNAAKEATITDYHWTLGKYIECLADAGGVIRGLDELPAAFDADGKPVGPPAYVALRVERG